MCLWGFTELIEVIAETVQKRSLVSNSLLFERVDHEMGRLAGITASDSTSIVERNGTIFGSSHLLQEAFSRLLHPGQCLPLLSRPFVSNLLLRPAIDYNFRIGFLPGV